VCLKKIRTKSNGGNIGITTKYQQRSTNLVGVTIKIVRNYYVIFFNYILPPFHITCRFDFSRYISFAMHLDMYLCLDT
jgi:hypothetical protein